jgi:SAM-dependent methyltransferase
MAEDRPVRREVAAAYDRGVEGYVTVWSEVILPPAEAVVAALRLESSASVVDVGAGSGALLPAIRRASPQGTVIAVDASIEMLRACRDRTGVEVVLADAVGLPIRSVSADAVLLAFVLFHLSEPQLAMTEAARILRPGGVVGIVTWAWESALPAYAVWDDTLTRAGAPALAPRRVDRGLDSPDAIEHLLAATGFASSRTWTASLSRQWTAESYLKLATGSGLNRLRLDALDEPTRNATVERAYARLLELPPTAFAWSGEVVCAVAQRW